MISSQNIEDRIRKCLKILDNDPNSQIFAALADAYRKSGNLDQAFKICQNGLKIHSSYASAHIVMSKINLDRGLYDWAAIEAQKAADLDGNNRTIELLLAEIYIYKGEFKKATDILEKLSKFDPSNYQIKKLLEIAYSIPKEQAELLDGKNEDKTETDSEKIEAVDGQVEDDSTPLKLTDKQIVNKCIQITGINGVMLINDEGLILEKKWTSKLDADICGASLSDVGFFLNRELMENSFGRFHSVMIEIKDNTYFLKQVPVGLILLVASKKANLGTVRMKIGNLLEQYR